ncbi:2-oxoacid:acceptor oxidoreductase subunit alpha [Desulfoferula mesophila]|uniref:2-oxoglutarate ferredoxin oxidoreductase subunit alpha n=1 Tax=Desulfoferula mesophila TaxID=3058419 RepID=A0AAU9EM57_9BACT|nr:2-oxoglutarate ferredoxin oxidoreductase subunit alpha [Desulfoferula mesophilus]
MKGQSKEVLLLGNEACVEGAIMAGVRFFAGYPITPASEIAEHMSLRLPQEGGCFIQMEDEIGSVTAATGASMGGVKAMTASSGPGISLKQEGIGCAAIMEVPLVIVNVQRGGPGIGNIQPAQGDVMQARWGTHGGVHMIALAPSSVQECFDLTVKAVNLSERFRVPVMILSDASIGHMREKVTLPESLELVERPRPKVDPKDYLSYDTEAPDGVPPMADLGTAYESHFTSFIHNKKGFAAWTDYAITDALVHRLNNKLLMHLNDILLIESYLLDDADMVVVAHGSTARPSKAAVNRARQAGIKAGLLKLLTVWPFPYEHVRSLAKRTKTFLVPELNLGQLAGEVERCLGEKNVLHQVNRVDGGLLTPDQILAAIEEAK